mmetsp:Transcript_10153/g.30021  ORF Transcript_10153/g.30021 Transcript_10153/m.30021 type:complete len:206 (+) Transcript_10153:145-762(+)
MGQQPVGRRALSPSPPRHEVAEVVSTLVNEEEAGGLVSLATLMHSLASGKKVFLMSEKKLAADHVESLQGICCVCSHESVALCHPSMRRHREGTVCSPERGSASNVKDVPSKGRHEGCEGVCSGTASHHLGVGGKRSRRHFCEIGCPGVEAQACRGAHVSEGDEGAGAQGGWLVCAAAGKERGRELGSVRAHGQPCALHGLAESL